MTIRYDPNDPESFYYRDLVRSRVKIAVVRALVVMAIVVFFGAMLVLRIGGGISRR